MAGENENLDIDLDDDLLDEGEEGSQGHAGSTEPPVKLGDQDDGSVVVELEESQDAVGKQASESKEGHAEGLSDEEKALEEKRERRRQERQEQKQRRREEEARMKRELQAERERAARLEERLAVIERRSEGSELAQIDAGIQQLGQAYNALKVQHQQALTMGNAIEATETMEKMMQVRQKHDQLQNVKKAFNERKAAPPPLDDRLRVNAEKFLKDHAWVNAPGTDATIVRALDQELASEGWDAKTDAYWDELRSRVKKHLPHRFSGSKVLPNGTDGDRSTGQASKPKSVVAGSDRGASASAPGKQTFRLSPERVQAMKDAGIWDDPKSRNEAIKRYREFDQRKG